MMAANITTQPISSAVLGMTPVKIIPPSAAKTLSMLMIIEASAGLAEYFWPTICRV